MWCLKAFIKHIAAPQRSVKIKYNFQKYRGQEGLKEAINIPTKWYILSALAIVYDPVGYPQPTVIKLKILFQKICKSKIEWDDDIGV